MSEIVRIFSLNEVMADLPLDDTLDLSVYRYLLFGVQRIFIDFPLVFDSLSPSLDQHFFFLFALPNFFVDLLIIFSDHLIFFVLIVPLFQQGHVSHIFEYKL